MLSLIAPLLLAASPFTPQLTATLSDPTTGAPTLEVGVLSAPLQGDLVKAVQAWADTQREHYRLPAGATLRPTEAFSTRFGASFHFQAELNGVEIYLQKLVVTLDDKRRVVQVASSLDATLQPTTGKTLDLASAMIRGAKTVPLVAYRSDGLPYGGGKRMYFASGTELHPGWLLNVDSIDRRRNWYVAIDEVTGERLFMQNRVHQGALDAQVYPISPGGLDAGVGLTPTVLRTLTHADGGSLIGDTCVTPLLDGGHSSFPNDAGELCGDQLMMYNCCPTAGCVADAGVARTVGSTMADIGLGFPVPVDYDVAVCERVRRASNVRNPTHDFVYTPVDPPLNRSMVLGSDPANSDEFAEVHSFFHVNTVYDWVRALSRSATPIFGTNPAITPFMMRDERRTPAVKVAVWSNAMFPDFNALLSTGCVPMQNPFRLSCRGDALLRLDNAAFLPRENFAQIPLPGFDTGADTLMIFQGNSADAAYDATVIQHEFGHGVVYATANLGFDAVAYDNRSVNNESGALHEGFADYIAAAFNDVAEVGPYFGPRVIAAQGSIPGVPVDAYLRTMNNTSTCPSVLWGEVHQDALHVAGALWDGRKALRGTDNGATYDAAFYAMLVSITPTASFETVATAMAARVSTAFNAAAGTQVTGFFTARGVIGCSKILDATSPNLPRPYFGVASASATFGNSMIPGPFQIRVPGAAGIASIRVTGVVGQNQLGGATPDLSLLSKTGTPITFTRAGGQLSNDATAVVLQKVTVQMVERVDSTVTVNAPCGSDLYVTIGTAGGGANLQNLNIVATPLVNCMLPVLDAGMGGGAGGGSGGGTATGGGSATGGGGGSTQTMTLQSVGPNNVTSQPPAAVGCGCATGGELGAVLFALTALLRRRRS